MAYKLWTCIMIRFPCIHLHFLLVCNWTRGRPQMPIDLPWLMTTTTNATAPPPREDHQMTVQVPGRERPVLEHLVSSLPLHSNTERVPVFKCVSSTSSSLNWTHQQGNSGRDGAAASPSLQAHGWMVVGWFFIRLIQLHRIHLYGGARTMNYSALETGIE